MSIDAKMLTEAVFKDTGLDVLLNKSEVEPSFVTLC